MLLEINYSLLGRFSNDLLEREFGKDIYHIIFTHDLHNLNDSLKYIFSNEMMLNFNIFGSCMIN